MKIFYDRLINISDIITEVERLQIQPEEKEELAQLVDSTIHHEVISVILTNLPQENHQEFLERFHAKPHDDKLLDYLKAKIGDIEDKLQHTGKALKEKIKDLLQ